MLTCNIIMLICFLIKLSVNTDICIERKSRVLIQLKKYATKATICLVVRSLHCLFRSVCPLLDITNSYSQIRFMNNLHHEHYNIFIFLPTSLQISVNLNFLERLSRMFCQFVRYHKKTWWYLLRITHFNNMILTSKKSTSFDRGIFAIYTRESIFKYWVRIVMLLFLRQLFVQFLFQPVKFNW